MSKVRIIEVQAKSILSRASGYIGAYDYTLSATQGCGHGCSFCYVPTLYFHRRLAPTWGRELFVKANAVALLSRDGKAGKLTGARIFWSPNTDPLQPHEAKLKPHERQFSHLLDLFCEFPPEVLVVQTRSPWVQDYIDQFQRLGRHVVVAMSIGTDREDVRRRFEPTCPSILKRIEALAALHEAGIRTQASLAPLLPCTASVLGEMVEPYSSWAVAQALKMSGPGARTWAPALKILRERGWDGWLEGGQEVRDAMSELRVVLGPKYHEAREGFSFPALLAKEVIPER